MNRQVLEVDSDRLPEGWEISRLGDLVIQSKEKRDPMSCPSDPYIGMGDVEPHTMKLLNVSSCSDYRSKGNAFDPGDVLYGRLRPYLNKVFMPDFSGVSSGEFIVMRPCDGLRLEFLAWVLNSLDFVRFAESLDTGDRPRVSFEQISDYLVAVPPITVQSEVLAAIDEEFVHIDAIEAELDQIEALQEQFRRALLRDAFNGRLVSSHGAPEAGDVDSKGRPQLPEGWEWRPLVDLTSVCRRGLAPSYEGGSVPVINQKCVRGLTIVDRNFEKRTNVQVKPLPNWAFLQDGDVLINSTGTGTLGRVGWIRGEVGEATVDSHVSIVRADRAVVSCEFLGWFLHAHESLLVHLGGGSTNQKELRPADLQQVLIPVPPSEKQRQIVEAIELQLARSSAVPAAIKELRAQLDRARASILHHAFTGRLLQNGPSTC